MVNKASRAKIRENKHRRLRHHLNGTATTPRLAVFRSNKHIYAQIIDDTVGKTLVSASTLQKDVKAELENTGVVVLEDRAMQLEYNGDDITLIGLSDPSFTLKGDMFGEVPAMVDTKLRGLIGDKDNYTILLSHRPELFEAYVNCGVDLVLSGHAHGGQFRLPFIGGLVAPNQGLFPKYDAGLYTKGDTNMIVCRGLGNSIIPIRFNNRPEIVLLELIAE